MSSKIIKSVKIVKRAKMKSMKAKKTAARNSKTPTSKIKTAARNDAAKAEVRELILATARQFVIKNDFAQLSIRKLADLIGYAPGTIYLYFRDRDELVREICVRGLVELSAKIQAAAEVADAQNRLTALLYAYVDFAMENPETYRLSFMENPAFTQEAMRAEPLETEDGAGKQAFAQIVKTLQKLKGERKINRAENEHLLAELLWTTVHGIVSLRLVYPAFPVNSVEKLIDKLLETLLSKANETKTAGKFTGCSGSGVEVS
jgi:AcrR family transcriptional regulator